MCGMDDVVTVTPQGHWRCVGTEHSMVLLCHPNVSKHPRDSKQGWMAQAGAMKFGGKWLLFSERESWGGFKPRVMWQHLTVHPLKPWPCSKLSGAAPFQGCAGQGDASAPAGAWALLAALPLSSFLQMFGVHFVLKSS